MKLGRLIIDTHVHAQRHAVGPKFKKQGVSDYKNVKYEDLAKVMPGVRTYDNSDRLIFDMECYGVDMCILCSAFGMNNEINLQLVEKYPDKFRALAYPKETADKALAGEIEWTMEQAVEELDQLLSTGKFIGTGEGMPANYWTELYYEALADPNVGAEKLMWGTDWGASIPIQTRLGNHPQTFAAQVHREGIVTHQVDVMGWSLKQVSRLNISQDDMNLILGGNALRIYKIDFPLTRLFKDVN